MSVYNVILSGGVGSRLWPLSRKQHPKQFLKLFSGKALFELTAERNQKSGRSYYGCRKYRSY